MKHTAVVALLLLTACAGPPVPTNHYYRLEVGLPEESTGARLPGTLEVARFHADGLVADRPLNWISGDAPHELRVYHYHHWTAPPATLLQDALVEYLRAANVADRIVTPELRADSDHIILGRLRRLEMVTGARPAVLFELELGLRERDPRRIALVRSYTEQRPLAEDSVDAAVLALGDAVSEVYARFVADLAAR